MTASQISLLISVNVIILDRLLGREGSSKLYGLHIFLFVYEWCGDNTFDEARQLLVDHDNEVENKEIGVRKGHNICM